MPEEDNSEKVLRRI